MYAIYADQLGWFWGVNVGIYMAVPWSVWECLGYVLRFRPQIDVFVYSTSTTSPSALLLLGGRIVWLRHKSSLVANTSPQSVDPWNVPTTTQPQQPQQPQPYSLVLLSGLILRGNAEPRAFRWNFRC